MLGRLRAFDSRNESESLPGHLNPVDRKQSQMNRRRLKSQKSGQMNITGLEALWLLCARASNADALLVDRFQGSRTIEGQNLLLDCVAGRFGG